MAGSENPLPNLEGILPPRDLVHIGVDSKLSTPWGLENLFTGQKYGHTVELWQGYPLYGKPSVSFISLGKFTQLRLSASLYNPAENSTPEEFGYVTDLQLEQIMHQLERKKYQLFLDHEYDDQRIVTAHTSDGVEAKIFFGWPNASMHTAGVMSNELNATTFKKMRRHPDITPTPIQFYIYNNSGIPVKDSENRPFTKEEVPQMAHLLQDSLNAVFTAGYPSIKAVQNDILLTP